MIDLDEANISVPQLNTYSGINDSIITRFYLNGEALHEARWPNAGQPAEDYFTVALPEKTEGYNEKGQKVALSFTDNKNRSSEWDSEKLNEASIIGGVSYLWGQECLRIDRIDTAKKIVYTSSPGNYGQNTSASASDPSRYIYFSNIFEEIDQPGESFIDRENNILYFCGIGDMSAPKLELADLGGTGDYYTEATGLLQFSGASHITFSGIDIRNNCKSMIKIDSSSDSITIKDAVLSGGARKPVMTIDGSKHRIENCEFYDFVGSAISLSGGDRATLTSSGTVITNNKIHGNVVCTNAVDVSGVGHVISHNEIYDIGKAAINFKNTNNILVEYNKIHDCHLIGDDGSALYWGRNISELGNVVRYNYFENIDSGIGANPLNAIFIDDGGAGPEIYGNIFNNACTSASGAIRTNGGNNLNVHDNIIMNSESAGAMSGWENSSIGLSNKKIQPANVWMYHNGFRNGLNIKDVGNNTEFGFGSDSRNSSAKELMFSDIWINSYAGTTWASLFDYYTKENYNACKVYYDAAIADKTASAINELKTWVEDNLPQIITNNWENNVYINVDEHTVSRNANGAVVGTNLDLGSEILSTGNPVFKNYGTDYTLTDEALTEIRKIIPDFEAPDYNNMGIIGVSE